MSNVLARVWYWLLNATKGHDQIPYRILLALAFVSTTWGVGAYYLAGKEPTIPVLLEGLLVVALTGVFVGLMALAIEHAFDRRAPIANWPEFFVRAGWVFMYGVLFFISLSFSFAFWWGLFSASGETKTTTINQITEDTKTLGKLSDSITNIVKAANTRASISQALSDKESTAGYSCETRSGSDYGPITQLRKDDAEETRRLAATMNEALGLVDKVPESSIKSKPQTEAPAQETARTLLIDAKSLTNQGGTDNMQSAQEKVAQSQEKINSAVRSMKSLEQSFEELATHYEDSKDRSTICKHGQTKTGYRNIAVSLRTLTEYAPQKLEVYTGEKAVIEAVSRLWSPFGLTRFLPGTRVTKMTDGDFLPLVFSLIVDVGLMIIGFALLSIDWAAIFPTSKFNLQGCRISCCRTKLHLKCLTQMICENELARS
jgi:hypothetical protein